MSCYGLRYGFTYDDEDRLVRLTSTSGIVDTFTYNGLGLRVAKSDSTGSYSYVCDGTTPGSPVLSDGHTVFTAGLSSTVAGLTSFRHEDALGSLRYLTDSGQNVLGSSVFEAFGATVGATGSTAGAPFGWVGGADCQTEADTGLVLMGHRLYDSRLGRFLSPDPAGAGNNWYQYAGNDPVNKTDPTGLYIRAMPPLHGAFYSDPGGLFGGQNTLDALFGNEVNYSGSDYTKAQEAQDNTIALAGDKASLNNEGQSVNLYLGMVFDFFAGYGDTIRNYGANSTQVQTFLASAAANDLFLQLAGQGFSKNASGGVGHIQAYLYALGDPFNGSQGHMGAFDWHVERQIGNNLNIVVHNDMSRASMLGGNAFGFGVSNPTYGSQRTISEYLRFTVPIPR